MKKVLVITLSVLLLLGALVAPIVAIITGSASDADQSQPYTPPVYYDSVAEFEAAERSSKNGSAHYYIPTVLPENSTFKRISKRDNEYIAVTYSVDTSGIDTTGFSRYEMERISSLICELNLYEDGTVPLISFKGNGFKPIDYQGRTIYYFEDYDPLNPDKRLIGYSIAFLQDGYCIYMHLPAIDTFENMMQYANVTRVTIE